MLVETAAAACLHLAATLGCGARLTAVNGSSSPAPQSSSVVLVSDVCLGACPPPASAVQAAEQTVTFSITDVSEADWFFAGDAKKWVEQPGSGWIIPDSMKTPEDGNLAVLTQFSFSTFNATFDFVVGQGADAECWSTAAFVFQATDAQHFKVVEFPYQGQQNRAEHFWATVSEVSDSSGWRATKSMQGPVHGVTSGNSWPHSARVELHADGLLYTWVDGRPLQPVNVGVASGYVGLASYNLLGNDVGRVRNVAVRGVLAGAPAPFDKTLQLGRGFTNIEVPGKKACGGGQGAGCVTTTHVGRMVRAPNGDLIAPNGATLLRTVDNGTTWTLDDGLQKLQHITNTVHEGKPALANLQLRASGGSTPPCADCAYPPGTQGELVRRISTDNGRSWTPLNDSKAVIGQVAPPPVTCVPTAYGPAVNCSALGWRWGGFNSILPLRDGKTILAFGVIHNGDLMMGTANRRTIMATYAQDPLTKRPVPTYLLRLTVVYTAVTGLELYDLGFGFALQSTDGGVTFDSEMINLDGPWENQTAMFPKGEPMQTLEISPFETSAGDILVLDRPASSPWMWESWAASPTVGGKSTASAGGISKVEFGPATRGPFPLYACYDATITTASGAMVICGRYPALSCQLSLDSGMTWSMTTIDISGIWAQGTLFELEPDVVLFTYGGRGPGAGGTPWNARYQKMRVDADAKRLVHLHAA